MGKKIGVLLIILIFGIQKLYSQSTTGSIEGWIIDKGNQPVVYVNVLVTSSDLQGSRGTSADERGYFRIQALPVGIYSIKISHIAYQNVFIKDVNVLLGQTTSLGLITLDGKAVETNEVIISGNKPVIDSRSTTNGKSLSAKQFDKLPIERNYFQMAELLPGSDISYKGDKGTNFSGGTGVENLYFLDGAEINIPTYGGPLFELPYNFIREVEIRTGGYQAEFQSSLGGIINTVTYTGGNEFHGKLFGFLTNNSLRGDPRINEGQAPLGNYSNSDIGFGAGGPIIKDRLWYYLAYDPNFNSQDVFVNGLGIQKTYSTEHKFAGKLTWSADKNNLLTFSLCGDPYNSKVIHGDYSLNSLKVINPEAVVMNDNAVSISSTARGIHTLSDIFMIESSISFSTIREVLKPTYPGGSSPAYVDYVAGTISGGLGITQLNPELNMYSGSIKGTLSLPANTIKAGLGYTLNSTTRDQDFHLREHYPTYYAIADEYIKGTVKEKNFSAFLQDSWQISQRFCLNFGIRWDPQWFIASDGTLAQKITDQWQPRLGMIYQPGEIGTQKITASFGRFYQPIQLALSIFYHIKGAYYNAIYYPNDPRVDTSGAYYAPNMNPFITNIPNLQGQYEDEYSIGYERLFLTEFKLGIRGIYRRLGQGVEDGVASPEDQSRYQALQVYGNPGSGMLSMLPKLKRDYTALELTFERFSSSGFNFFVSYVLSRNYGNYDGLAETNDGTMVSPNVTNQSALPIRMVNSEGLLPNDRTHVFKLAGSYMFDFGFTAGVVFQWMSGTPINEFGVDSTFHVSTFLQPRGTVGRTPSIWDLNFRFMYDLSNIIQANFSSKLVLDLMHVASPKTVLDYDQYHYYDYWQQYPNTNYMKATQFLPPMMIRLGLEVNF